MRKHTSTWLILGMCFAAAGVHLLAQDSRFLMFRPDFPLWAYGYVAPPAMPEDWSMRCLGNRPRDCDRPGGMPTDASNALLRVAGSDRSFTTAQITSPYAPADWFPNDHPPMPDIVAHGKEASGFRACAICHLPNGQGLMQNAPVAGLPVDYFLRQIADLASGARKTADLHKANGFEMAAMARNLTPAEARAAAEYYAAIPFKPWVKVIESNTLPKFMPTRNGLFLKAEGNETEPLGRRLIELPESTFETNNLRNPRSGMVAYAPVGSLARGRDIVTTGGGVSMECLTCHGMDLRGTPIAPPIAGRQPSYLGRQLYDIKVGTRNGAMAQVMKPAVAQLTPDDMIAVVAYVSSLRP
jgi:cytochrome c553